MFPSARRLTGPGKETRNTNSFGTILRLTRMKADSVEIQNPFPKSESNDCVRKGNYNVDRKPSFDCESADLRFGLKSVAELRYELCNSNSEMYFQMFN